MKKLKSLFSRSKQPSFETLIKGEQEKLYKIAYTYVRNEQDALDVVQDAIIKGYNHFDKLKNLDYFSTWMTRILINTALDAVKRKKDVVYLDQDRFDDKVTKDPPFTQQIDLLEELNHLKPEQKTLVILRFYYGYSIKELAELLKKPEGTIKSQLHRTLNELKKKLGEGGEQYGKAWSKY
ncbi:RNA polymerase sigma factor SigV [Halalkalibacter wakoensis JCM 9140]|uniref:RNA polymerase sigma factor SigV n=1 Tax=Halalkalibacter wakoensis JCM 9140 TaxID=1236970 RepID=W4Q0Q8_9BACI|nr:sigma-70 family RNA polymerase sigma factor [Halalkalibacter wakoensis]GAE25562.1 RNA polymerase sigma factor SigV [Halalkalibacter wakoensis JCM 9140]